MAFFLLCLQAVIRVGGEHQSKVLLIELTFMLIELTFMLVELTFMLVKLSFMPGLAVSVHLVLLVLLTFQLFEIQTVAGALGIG